MDVAVNFGVTYHIYDAVNEEDAEDKAQVLALAAYGGAFVNDCCSSSEEME